jgi:poly(A) polymerase
VAKNLLPSKQERKSKSPKDTDKSSRKKSSKDKKSRSADSSVADSSGRSSKSSRSNDRKRNNSTTKFNLPGNPLIIQRDEHCVSRKNIDDDCLKVIRRLNQHGFQSFLVGGGVRDLLLNKVPKDFDLSSSASPEDVRTLFRNSRIIGRRFRLNHVYFRGNKIIEVSTFRRSSEDDDDDSEGEMLSNDNLYGDAETDAFRRDLTINGLFYDLTTFSIIDYVGGMEDLERGIVRMIGDPVTRFEEDPVRMIRAVRHAARAGFKIEKKTYKAICEKAELIAQVPPSRIYEEFLKDIRGGSFWVALQLLFETGLLHHLLPTLAESLTEKPKEVWQRLDYCLQLLDEKVRQSNAEYSPALVFALLFFGNLPERMYEEFLSSEDGEELISIWSHSSDEFEEFAPVSPTEEISILQNYLKEITRSSRSRRSKGAARFSDSLSEVLKGLVVPKRERELLEQLLFARRLMVVDTDAKTRGLGSKSFFQEALFFLDATAQSDREGDASDAWHEKKVSKKPQSKDRRRR